jgi:general secretion pathway protein A
MDPVQSPNYEPYYGLTEQPFSLTPDPRFLYKSGPHGPVFDTLLAAVRRRNGITVVTGSIGTGKTTLCRAVLQQLDRRAFTAFVPHTIDSRDDLFKFLLVHYGIIAADDVKNGRFDGSTRPELSVPLYEFLKSLGPMGAFAVVVIDEAQRLSARVLEEIRIFSDFTDGQGREKLVQVVLVGQPELKTQLASPDMRALEQRIMLHCQLDALDEASRSISLTVSLLPVALLMASRSLPTLWRRCIAPRTESRGGSIAFAIVRCNWDARAK